MGITGFMVSWFQLPILTGDKMHSSDRTLLAKLGFADPDRQNSLHDIACQYLSQPELVAAISEVIEPGLTSAYRSRFTTPEAAERFGRFKYANEFKAIFEYHIQKGQGQYATTIGFCDLLLTLKFIPPQENFDVLVVVPIEVKITKCTIGDAIRQIGVYKSYLPPGFERNHPCQWILATAFDISENDVKCLRTNAIHHVRLGAGLNDFAEKHRSENNVAKSRIL